MAINSAENQPEKSTDRSFVAKKFGGGGKYHGICTYMVLYNLCSALQIQFSLNYTTSFPKKLGALMFGVIVVCLEGKRENYQVCSVQYCVQQLCTVQCTVAHTYEQT